MVLLKYLIMMIGLPASGKSYLSNNIQNTVVASMFATMPLAMPSTIFINDNKVKLTLNISDSFIDFTKENNFGNIIGFDTKVPESFYTWLGLYCGHKPTAPAL